MRRVTLAVLSVLLLAWQAPAQDRPGVAVGKNIPATIHAYNVTQSALPTAEPDDKAKGATRKAPRATKDKYHCLITEYDLDPVVMLVVRDAEDKEAVHHLIQQLDGLVVRNSGLRFRAFVVFLFDARAQPIKDVVTDDDNRKAAADLLKGMKAHRGLKGVVLTIAGTDDPGLAKFGLSNDALQAVVYRKLKVEALHSLSKDRLDKLDDVGAIIKDVKEKFKLDAEKDKGKAAR